MPSTPMSRTHILMDGLTGFVDDAPSCVEDRVRYYGSFLLVVASLQQRNRFKNPYAPVESLVKGSEVAEIQRHRFHFSRNETFKP